MSLDKISKNDVKFIKESLAKTAKEERDKAVRAIEADIKEEFDSEEAFQILSIIYKHL